MNNVSVLEDPIRELTPQEVHIVSGGEPGYSLEDGSSFTWVGYNGVPYEGVVFVGRSYFEFEGGSREYYVDIFYTPSYPLPDLQGFMNALTAAGSPPVYVSWHT